MTRHNPEPKMCRWEQPNWKMKQNNHIFIMWIYKKYSNFKIFYSNAYLITNSTSTYVAGNFFVTEGTTQHLISSVPYVQQTNTINRPCRILINLEKHNSYHLLLYVLWTFQKISTEMHKLQCYNAMRNITKHSGNRNRQVCDVQIHFLN